MAKKPSDWKRDYKPEKWQEDLLLVVRDMEKMLDDLSISNHSAEFFDNIQGVVVKEPEVTVAKKTSSSSSRRINPFSILGQTKAYASEHAFCSSSGILMVNHKSPFFDKPSGSYTIPLVVITKKGAERNPQFSDVFIADGDRNDYLIETAAPPSPYSTDWEDYVLVESRTPAKKITSQPSEHEGRHRGYMHISAFRRLRQRLVVDVGQPFYTDDARGRVPVVVDTRKDDKGRLVSKVYIGFDFHKALMRGVDGVPQDSRDQLIAVEVLGMDEHPDSDSPRFHNFLNTKSIVDKAMKGAVMIAPVAKPCEPCEEKEIEEWGSLENVVRDNHENLFKETLSKHADVADNWDKVKINPDPKIVHDLPKMNRGVAMRPPVPLERRISNEPKMYVKNKKASKPLRAEKKGEGYHLSGRDIVQYVQRPTIQFYSFLFSMGSVGVNVVFQQYWFAVVGILAMIAVIVAPGGKNQEGKLIDNKEKKIFSHPEITNSETVRTKFFQDAIAEYVDSPDDVEWWSDQFRRLNSVAIQVKSDTLESSRLERTNYAIRAEIHANELAPKIAEKKETTGVEETA